MSLQDAADPTDPQLDKARRSGRVWRSVFIVVFLGGAVAAVFWAVLAAAYPSQFTWTPPWFDEPACDGWPASLDKLGPQERPCHVRKRVLAGVTVGFSAGRAEATQDSTYRETELEYSGGQLVRITEVVGTAARTRKCTWWERRFAPKTGYSQFEPGPPDWDSLVGMEAVRFPRLEVDRRTTENGEAIELDIDGDNTTDRSGTVEFDAKGRVTRATWTEAACPEGLDVWERTSCPPERQAHNSETRWLRDDKDRLVKIVTDGTVQLELDYCD